MNPVVYLNHITRMIQLRTELYLEARKAKHQGNRLPSGLVRNLWSKPHIHEEYIWLLRFISTNDKITLIDIGGNTGAWAEGFLRYYPEAFIYGFEPVKEMYRQYALRFANNKKVTIYNTALGEHAEERLINVAEGYGLTSFNTYEGVLTELNKNFTKEEKVLIGKLDNYLSSFICHRTVIKVDVQGFESEVIKGGMEVFKNADAIIIESSFINEYKLQSPSFGEVVCLLRGMDLHPIRFGAYDQSKSPIAYERNVLFVKASDFSKIWDK